MNNNLDDVARMIQRQHNEENDEYGKRKEFQHDRDRIIHSKAFRRMMHKTQIFNANKGDHYRNRLTHTLEVTQIARSIGRLLNLNEDLIEAIALGHDLGHTPFGHIGERALNKILNEGLNSDIPAINEGFKHNYQSLRVVDSIENRCDEYWGLNLTLAVREGIIKHTKICSKKGDLVKYNKESLNLDFLRMDLDNSITLEGQVVAIADEIAQITHDIEDGIRGKIISFDDFLKSDLIQDYIKDINLCDEEINTYNKKNKVLKGSIGYLINDVYTESQRNIEEYHAKYGEPTFVDRDGVYEKACIAFSKKTKKQANNLAKMRDNKILFSEEISKSDSKSEYMIRQLFKAYYKHPKELPDYILARYCDISDTSKLERNKLIDRELQKDPLFIRLICDHIAGMTDQFAAREYVGLYNPEYY